MKAIQIVLDDSTAERFEAFADQFAASEAQVAAGLVRAALRWSLRPEKSPIGKGRPAPTLATALLRILVRKPQTREALLATFPTERHVDVAAALVEIGPRISQRPTGELEIGPVFVATYSETAEVKSQKAAEREERERTIVESRVTTSKRLNEMVTEHFGAVPHNADPQGRPLTSVVGV